MIIQRFFCTEQKHPVFNVFTGIEMICRLVISPSISLLEPGDMMQLLELCQCFDLKRMNALLSNEPSLFF